MFILDSLMISGIRWALETAITAAEAEMNDDSILREQLLEAEMRREMGEISDAEFQDIEADLLARIREIKARREGGAGPLAFGAQPMETTGDSTFQIEASISGDFYDPADAPHTTVIESLEPHHAVGHLVGTSGAQEIELLDMQPGDPAPPAPAPPQHALDGGSAAPGARARGARSKVERARHPRHARKGKKRLADGKVVQSRPRSGSRKSARTPAAARSSRTKRP
jgi:hypothetical protein